jgi:hypothetical protein
MLKGHPQGIAEKSLQHISLDPRLLLNKGRIENSLFSARNDASASASVTANHAKPLTEVPSARVAW